MTLNGEMTLILRYFTEFGSFRGVLRNEFGGPNPSVCGIHINGKPIHWVNKIKYLGVYLLCNAGLTDITDSVRKFHGKFNNIMAVLSKH